MVSLHDDCEKCACGMKANRFRSDASEQMQVLSSSFLSDPTRLVQVSFCVGPLQQFDQCRMHVQLPDVFARSAIA